MKCWPTVMRRPKMRRRTSPLTTRSLSSSIESTRGIGHHLATAEATDLALHPALLVGPVGSGDTEEAVEAVVRAQGDEALALLAIPALQHPSDGRLEVVVADAEVGHPAEVPVTPGAVRPGRRDRRVQRLAHRLPMDAEGPGQRPLRQPLALVCLADLLEQLHLRPRSHAPHGRAPIPPVVDPRPHEDPPGWGQIR